MLQRDDNRIPYTAINSDSLITECRKHPHEYDPRGIAVVSRASRPRPDGRGSSGKRFPSL